jgi:YycE-like C-terminal domain
MRTWSHRRWQTAVPPCARNSYWDIGGSYWDIGGVTIADPDGYRIVLTQRSWGRNTALPSYPSRSRQVSAPAT